MTSTMIPEIETISSILTEKDSVAGTPPSPPIRTERSVSISTEYDEYESTEVINVATTNNNKLFKIISTLTTSGVQSTNKDTLDTRGDDDMPTSPVSFDCGRDGVEIPHHSGLDDLLPSTSFSGEDTNTTAALDAVEVEMDKTPNVAENKSEQPPPTDQDGGATKQQEVEVVSTNTAVVSTNTEEEKEKNIVLAIEKLNSVVIATEQNKREVNNDEDIIDEVVDSMVAMATSISDSLKPIIYDIAIKVEEPKPSVLDNLSKASGSIKTSLVLASKSVKGSYNSWFGKKTKALYEEEEVVPQKSKGEVIDDAVKEAYDIFRQISKKW